MRIPRKSQIVLTVAGLLVGLLAVYRPVFTVAGRETAGVVTQAMYFVDRPADETAFGYHVRYQFAVDGEDYFGSANRKDIRDVRRLPSVGSLIEVRYLPGAPFLNASAEISPWPGFVVGAMGLLLIGLSVRLAFRRAAKPSELSRHGVA